MIEPSSPQPVPTNRSRRWPGNGPRKLGAVLLASAVAMSMALVAAPPVTADTAPLDPANPATPVTVSADALPTVQIDGIVWQQVIIGNVAYAVGQFNTARPAGAAPGTNTVARNNILAYDVTTGTLITTFTASLNGMAKTIAASPDGSKLFVGGAFSQVNGVARPYVAALNPTTGALITSWAPKVNSRVVALTASNNAVYMGGWFSGVGSVSRPKLAAVSTSNATLLNWNPVPAGGDVNTLLVSPDDSKVVVGGGFTTLNGSSNPGYGLGAVDTDTGGLLPWAANGLVRNGGHKQPSSASPATEQESTERATCSATAGTSREHSRLTGPTVPSSGSRTATATPMASTPIGDTAVYTVSHAHYCGNIGGFPADVAKVDIHMARTGVQQGSDGHSDRSIPTATSTGRRIPSPSLLQWYPEFADGTFTGQAQAAWNVTGNSQYIVVGGEFPSVNGNAQQGLVRFAVKGIAPNKRARWSQAPPSTRPLPAPPPDGAGQLAGELGPGQQDLTYQRHPLTARPPRRSTPRRRSPTSGRGRAWASSTRDCRGRSDLHTTRSSATDPSATPLNIEHRQRHHRHGRDASDYARGVLDDGAADYWRFGEGSGRPSTTGPASTTSRQGPASTRGAAGAIIGDTNTASTFDGNERPGVGATHDPDPRPGHVHRRGVVQDHDHHGRQDRRLRQPADRNSGSYDRHIYMDNAGGIIFGVYTGRRRRPLQQPARPTTTGSGTTSSRSLGSRHGALRRRQASGDSAPTSTSASPTPGYWRIGGDNLSGWPDQPASNYFNGGIDDVAIYPTALTATQVQTPLHRQRPHAEPAHGAGRHLRQGRVPPTTRTSTGGWARPPAPTAATATRNQFDGTYVGGVTFGAQGARRRGTTTRRSTFDGSTGCCRPPHRHQPDGLHRGAVVQHHHDQGGKLIGFGGAQIGGSAATTGTSTWRRRSADVRRLDGSDQHDHDSTSLQRREVAPHGGHPGLATA